VILLYILAALTVLTAIVVLQRWLSKRAKRRQLLELLPASYIGAHREKDEASIVKTKEIRDRILLNWSKSISITPTAIFDISTETAEAVAQVYYPGVEDPLRKAPLGSLLGLYGRTASRVNELFNSAPLKWLGKIELSHIMVIKDGADVVLNHNLVQMLKDSPVGTLMKKVNLNHLRRAANVAAKLGSWPKLALEVGAEISVESAKRLFISELVKIVAEESQRVYSGRFTKSDEVRVQVLLLFAEAVLLRQQGGPTAEEYKIFLRHITQSKKIDADLRMLLLAYAVGQEASISEELLEALEQHQVEESIRQEWQRFCQLEDFAILKNFTSGTQFIEKFRELLAVQGKDMTFKRQVHAKIERDL
jgi:hypothetical protein